MNNDINSKFYALLTLSVDDSAVSRDRAASAFRGVSDDEWVALYDMALKQALTAIVFSGVEKLPPELRPKGDMAVRWFVKCEKIRQRNVEADKKAVKVSQVLGAAGFKCCILKGQGNALMYPDARQRIAGDIDVWVDGGAAKALPHAKRLDPKAKFSYHHVELPPIKGVPVELHYRPAFLQNPLHNRRLQRYFFAHADEQFANSVALPDGAGQISVPTAAFNRIFQMSHIVNHFGHEGVGLRQIIDYYFLLRQGITDAERQECVRQLKSMGMYRFARGVMYVLLTVFGMDEQHLLASPDESIGRILLSEAMSGGNFGHYGDKFVSIPHHDKLSRNINRLWHDFRLMRSYPSELLFEPFFRLWHSLWRACWRARLARSGVHQANT